MFNRLVIISCCALGGFAFGQWLSPPAVARAIELHIADYQVATPVELPPPERAGRVPFLDVYRSLRSSSTKEHAAYLHSLKELPNGPDRRAALTAFFQCMASISPREAADLVQQVSKVDIERAVHAVLSTTSPLHTPDLVKMLLDLPADVDPKWREQMLNSQMFFWAALDPTAAARFADQYRSIYPDLAAQGIVQCLAAANPTAAERWLKEHPDLKKQPEVMNDYLHGLYQSDPAKAQRYLTEHAMEEELRPGLKAISGLIFLSSADDAAEFVRHLPTKDTRQLALAGVLNINTGLFINSETNQTALCAGLAEWVTKFSPDDWPTTMPQFLGRWRELDPDGSVTWMAKLPAPTRSAIAGELVRELPVDQLKQVLATTDGDFHHDVLTAFAQTLSQAPDERRAVVEALELPPEDAAQLAAIVRLSIEASAQYNTEVGMQNAERGKAH